MNFKRRKTAGSTEGEEEEELTDKKNSLDAIQRIGAELSRNRKQPVIVGLKKPEAPNHANVDFRNPLKSLSEIHVFAANSVVDAFEQRLSQFVCARDQIMRHPGMKTHYNSLHIDILANRIPSDLRDVVRTLSFSIGRIPSAILVKDPSGRMDLIFDTTPSNDYCCCSIEPSGGSGASSAAAKSQEDIDSSIATILSLKNRVISMDELSELFKDINVLSGRASTAKPAVGLTAMRSASLFTPLTTDTGTADSFEKLFMKKLFTFTETFQCTAGHLERISPSGNSICHNKIIFSGVSN